VPDLLDRILIEVRERLEVSRAAVAEYGRLEAALRALDEADQTGAGPAARAARRPGGARRGSARSTSRAPRGHNRRAVLAAVSARPGATVAELSAASGVSRPTIYAVVKSLAEAGEIRKRDLPAGQVGYAPGDVTARVEDGAPQTAGDNGAQ
jgi:hypothetical protein